jgi:hypothetical protein
MQLVSTPYTVTDLSLVRWATTIARGTPCIIRGQLLSGQVTRTRFICSICSICFIYFILFVLFVLFVSLCFINFSSLIAGLLCMCIWSGLEQSRYDSSPNVLTPLGLRNNTVVKTSEINTKIGHQDAWTCMEVLEKCRRSEQCRCSKDGAEKRPTGGGHGTWDMGVDC